MATVLKIEKDGVVIGEKEVKDGTILSDILVKNEENVIACKVWTMEDIISKMKDEGYNVTDEKISKINMELLSKHLTECTDNDWDMISYAIENSNVISLEEIVGEDEKIASFVLEGNYYENHFICDKDADERSDLLGYIEQTLHRLIDEGAKDGDIYRILGAEQMDDCDDEHFISIDLGYYIPSILSVNYNN